MSPGQMLAGEHNETWFVAKGICDVLGLGNITEALRALDDDEKSSFRNSDVAQNGGREGLDDDEIPNLRITEVWNQPGRAGRAEYL